MAIKPKTMLIYGESGDTKTSQLFNIAKYLYRTTGKKGRLITGDGGGIAPFEQSGMIDEGIVDVFDITNTPSAIADVHRLSQGYWYKVNTKTNTKEIKYEEKYKTSAKEFSEIGYYLIEGISAIANLFLNQFSSTESSNMGFKASWTIQDDEITISGLSEGHYGIIQREMSKIITKGFNTIPVERMFWTALVSKGNDKTGTSIFGPKGAGQASTSEIPTWFGDCIHLAEHTYLDKNGVPISKKVAWFVKHSEKSTGIECLAKSRILPELVPKLLNVFPGGGGFVPMGFERGLDVYIEAVDKLSERWRRDNKK